MIEFWREEDARNAEAAMHCAEIEGQNIAVQVYQPRRTSGTMEGFSVNAPPFVPSGSMFPYPTQVRVPFVQFNSLHNDTIVLATACKSVPSEIPSPARSVCPRPWAAGSTGAISGTRLKQS
jgi:hypothetical protein